MSVNTLISYADSAVPMVVILGIFGFALWFEFVHPETRELDAEDVVQMREQAERYPVVAEMVKAWSKANVVLRGRHLNKVLELAGQCERSQEYRAEQALKAAELAKLREQVMHHPERRVLSIFSRSPTR
ncbi:hypothetical protein [Ralstonia sp. ASV6]|uniref:hypothetical protein n=1 Tax=Ralstonia sp. ASV6 TaxID=2795124 RepID=UPI0018ED68F5|nr:hypothetical protein [Ralstonia sp. ASV6]